MALEFELDVRSERRAGTQLAGTSLANWGHPEDEYRFLGGRRGVSVVVSRHCGSRYRVSGSGVRRSREFTLDQGAIPLRLEATIGRQCLADTTGHRILGAEAWSQFREPLDFLMVALTPKAVLAFGVTCRETRTPAGCDAGPRAPLSGPREEVARARHFQEQVRFACPRWSRSGPQRRSAIVRNVRGLRARQSTSSGSGDTPTCT